MGIDEQEPDRLQTANRYPRRVAQAYGGDLTVAALDSDEVAATRVAAWERPHGVEPFDWVAIRRAERGNVR